MRRREGGRGATEGEVRSQRESHQEGGESAGALSKPNDSGASPGPP